MKESPTDERLTRRKAQLRRANARAKARQVEAIRTGEVETRGDLEMRMARRQARIKDATGRNRKDATARALLYYWGGPCGCNEHAPAIRYTSNRECLNCSIARRAEAATAPDEAAAKRRAYRAAEYARRKEKRAQAKAAQLAHVPDGDMMSPMAQLLGTILSTDG